MKCKNLQINSNLSLLITSANPGVDITLLFKKYDLAVGICTMPINKNGPIKLKISLSTTAVHDLTSDLNEKGLPQAFFYYSAYLLVFLTICCMISLSKKTTHNIVQCHIFCTTSGSKVTTEHISVSCVIVHSLPPEISVQYFLFIITVIIYNCICYSYVVNFIITTANTVTATITLNFRLNCTQFPARH